MASLEPSGGRAARRGFAVRLGLCGLTAAFGVVLSPIAVGLADAPAGVQFYSTAPPPVDYAGPAPVLLAMADAPVAAPVEVPRPEAAPTPKPAEIEEPKEPAPRLATAPSRSSIPDPSRTPQRAPSIAAPEEKPAPDPIVEARKMIGECKERYRELRDYTCVLYKRERVDGRLTSQHVMALKVRTQPFSVYLKFAKPNAGREAIYVAGRHGGKAVVHDVGLGKLLAGTLKLDPRSETAMEDCRHPITEAGLGFMIHTIDDAWAKELRSGESHVVVHPTAHVANRACTMIESTHPHRAPGFMFHKVKVYIDNELKLPVRFEAYDWPRRPGMAPDLLEEYTYTNLRLNPGLSERDFDPSNGQYSFGRF